MEQLINTTTEFARPSVIHSDADARTFIEANTTAISLREVKEQHIIPVFVKDNTPVISQAEFVETTLNAVKENYYSEQISNPVIRVSHEVKGRIPDAKDKPAHLLQDHEKTIYYDRMAFIIEIPTIQDVVDGSQLTLIVGGVKAHNMDNLYSRIVCDQHFKIFVGFQNKVCTNMCVWSDGYVGDVKVKNVDQLYACITTLLRRYNEGFHLFHLKQLCNYSITEQQFAQLVGRCRMYNHLPIEVRRDIPQLLFTDTTMGAVVKDYYRDASFCRGADGTINLWRFYNLLTCANKSSYIDAFVDRSVNAYNFVEQVRYGLENKCSCWYMS